jgi:hypothetical protein
MKKIIARIFSEILYCMGHWISFPMCYFDWAWLYPIYHRLMIWSSDVQDWAGNNKPWKET